MRYPGNNYMLDLEDDQLKEDSFYTAGKAVSKIYTVPPDDGRINEMKGQYGPNNKQYWNNNLYPTNMNHELPYEHSHKYQYFTQPGLGPDWLPGQGTVGSLPCNFYVTMV